MPAQSGYMSEISVREVESMFVLISQSEGLCLQGLLRQRWANRRQPADPLGLPIHLMVPEAGFRGSKA